MKNLCCIGLIASLLTGCQALNPPKPGDPFYAPIQPVKVQAQKKVMTGSLFTQNYSRPLFETLRASRVGDIVTILLVEQTTAEKRATTDQSKNQTTEITSPTVLGKPIKLPQGADFSFNLKGDRAFAGSGESRQNNKLSGSITVTVADVMDNGNLVIRGEKWININRGEEFIRVSGIIRPTDITPDNTIRSDRVANARISYSGTGQVADTNVQGWFARFFNTVFFPF